MRTTQAWRVCRRACVSASRPPSRSTRRSGECSNKSLRAVVPTRERHTAEESAGERVAASRERWNAGEVGWTHTNLEVRQPRWFDPSTRHGESRTSSHPPPPSRAQRGRFAILYGRARTSPLAGGRRPLRESRRPETSPLLFAPRDDISSHLSVVSGCCLRLLSPAGGAGDRRDQENENMLPIICHKRKHASSLFSSCSLRLLSPALVSGRGGRRPERTQRPATSLDRHVR